MRVLFLFALIVQTWYLRAQFTDSFSDGNLNQNPAWVYNPPDFNIAGNQLVSSNSAGGSYGISALRNQDSLYSFSMDFSLGFNPSSANYFEYFLDADTWTELAKNGLLVRAGDQNDNICLYQLQNGTRKLLISGKTGLLNHSSNSFSLKIQHSQGHMLLACKDLNSGKWQIEGEIPDTLHFHYRWTGFRIQQTGASAIGKHEFDNVFLSAVNKDHAGPEIISCRANVSQLIVQFNEIVITPSVSDFHVTGNSLLNLTPDTNDASVYVLDFANPFVPNIQNVLYYQNISDLNGNKNTRTYCNFRRIDAVLPQKGSLIITEIMANPAPAAGTLPEEEYVEIQNISPQFIHLGGCKLGDASASAELPDSLMAPGEIALVAKKTGSYSGNPAWRTIGVSSLPSLNNAGDFLYLIQPSGDTITSLNYTENWHSESWKKSGGWSLERIDTHYFCIEQGNWKSSQKGGGSPGKKNSVSGSIHPGPNKIVSAYCADSLHTLIRFSQPIDETFHFSSSQYYLTGKGIIPFQLSPGKSSLRITWNKGLEADRIYPLRIDSIPGCRGNEFFSQTLVIGFGTHTLDSGMLGINELLFDPYQDGQDMIEIYNRSSHILDLKNVKISNVNTGGSMGPLIPVPEYNLLPGQYLAFTTDTASLYRHYTSSDKNKVFQVPILPSWPNESGTALLTNSDGKQIDSFSYSSSMHIPLYAGTEGISLEKINPSGSSATPSNWTSAASVAGFATPGYQNSEFTSEGTNDAMIALNQKWFSPDGDGDHDLIQVNYKFSRAGTLCTAWIFSETGVSEGKLFENSTMEQSGSFSWNGTIGGRILPAGNYILYLDCLHPSGSISRKKLTISLLKKV